MPSLSFYFKKGHFLHNIMVTMDFKNRPPWNFRNRKNIPCTSLSLLFLPCSYHFPALWHTFGWNAQSFLSLNSWTLTDTWPLIITSSEKRTLTGLDFNLAFFAALIKADLGDWKGKWWQNISHTFKLKSLSFFFTFLVHWELHTYSNTLQTVHWRMEMQLNHNASWDNTYVHTYKESVIYFMFWKVSHSQTGEMRRALSAHSIPRSALMTIAVNQINFLLWPHFNLLLWNHLRSKCSALGKKILRIGGVWLTTRLAEPFFVYLQ